MIDSFKYYFKEGRRHKKLEYAVFDGHITPKEFFEEKNDTVNFKTDLFIEFLGKIIPYYIGNSIETRFVERIGHLFGNLDKYSRSTITSKGIVEDQLTLNPFLKYRRNT